MSIKDRINNITHIKDISLDTLPTMAKIEVTGLCTLNCSFCYHKELKKQKKRQKLMTVKQFKDCISFLKNNFPSVKEVGLFLMGESALHPKLNYFFRYLKENDYYTFLTTNATTISNIIPAIPYIDSLKVSYNYRSLEDYLTKTSSSINNYYTIRDNITTLYEETRKQNKPLYISAVLDTKEEDYTPELDKLPCTEYYFIPMQSQGGYYKGKDGVIGESSNVVPPLPCWSLFKGIYIDCDLNLHSCVYGHSDEHIYGNIYNFNRDKVQQMKKLHLNNTVPKECEQCLKNQ